MLCRFEVDGTAQRAHFRSRYLRSDAHGYAERTGRREAGEFGSPATSAWDLASGVLRGRATTDNACVSVTRFRDGRCVASTETARGAWAFDAKTLETLGRAGPTTTTSIADESAAPRHTAARMGPLQTAHAERVPCADGTTDDEAYVNVATTLFPRAAYSVFRTQGADVARRELVARIEPSRVGSLKPRFEASWIHAFGVTAEAVILIETPAVYNLGALALGTGRADHVSFDWKPDRGTWVHVVSLADGAVTTHQLVVASAGGLPKETKNVFFFHCANAFRDAETGDVCVDVAAFEDCRIVDTLKLENMEDAGVDIPESRLVRIRVSADAATLEDAPLDAGAASGRFAEFAKCNDAVRGRDYRFVYACGARRPTSAANVVTKTDVRARTTHKLQSELDYVAVGEPLFVAKPRAVAEDDGAVLSLGHTADGETHLVVYDAQSRREQARVVVPRPGIPYGFHVAWDPDDDDAA